MKKISSYFNPKTSRLLRKGLIWAGIAAGVLLLTGIGFVASVALGLWGNLPEQHQLEKIRQNNASVVFSSQGEMLGLFYHTNRTNARFEEIPQSFIDALIATEDVRFYEHSGFDARSFFRVVFKTLLLSDESSGGGSTITQQLVKNLFPRDDYGFMSLPVAKTKEIIIARRLEKIYPKNKILELYLNTVPFGENTYGIETAALTYFGKKPSELELQESALMVGLLKANTSYNPRIHQEAALNRRNTVIGQMVKYGYITQHSGDSLQALPVELNYQRLTHDNGIAPYFMEMIRGETEKILDEHNFRHNTDYNIYTDGLSIYTTLDAKLQEMADRSLTDQLAGLQKILHRQWRGNFPWYKDHELADLQIRQSLPYKHYTGKGFSHEEALDSMSVKRNTKIFSWQGPVDTLISPLDSVLYHFGILQGGLLAIDGRSGKVLAWVGGADFSYFKYDHVYARRQVGSTIKPLVYATAIENGLRPCDYFKNDSMVYPEADNWVPRNADRKYGGLYSLQGGLVHSVNTVSVKILMETGLDRTISALYDAGISRPLPKVPSLVLGTAEIPLHEMVPAYASFINGGKNPGIYAIDSIVDVTGKVIYINETQNQNPVVFSGRTQDIMKAILLEVTSRGTAAKLRWEYGAGNNIGGKTGTTQNYADGWFIGMSPKIVMGVWIGGDNPSVRFRTMRQGEGSKTAMPVFANVVKQARSEPQTADLFSGNFSIDPEIYDELNCEDFKEKRSLWDYLTGKQDYEKMSVSGNDTSDTKIERKQTKLGKFLRRVFGGKKDKRDDKENLP